MKCTKSLALIAVALLVGSCVVGCKKKPQNVTPLPGSAATRPGGNETPTPPIPPPPITIDTRPPVTSGPVTDVKPGELAPAAGDESAYNQDRERFKNETLHFAFDKSNLRSSDTPKLDTVFEAMKSLPNHALRIEGHCDERGTEEYNRALGERRALAAREYLVMKGMDPKLIFTISFGKDQPADPGHNDAAWAKNRRDEIILLVPKAK
jgi:peptidoglycan-associated lipoprotein